MPMKMTDRIEQALKRSPGSEEVMEGSPAGWSGKRLRELRVRQLQVSSVMMAALLNLHPNYYLLMETGKVPILPSRAKEIMALTRLERKKVHRRAHERLRRSA